MARTKEPKYEQPGYRSWPEFLAHLFTVNRQLQQPDEVLASMVAQHYPSKPSDTACKPDVSRREHLIRKIRDYRNQFNHWVKRGKPNQWRFFAGLPDTMRDQLQPSRKYAANPETRELDHVPNPSTKSTQRQRHRERLDPDATDPFAHL